MTARIRDCAALEGETAFAHSPAMKTLPPAARRARKEADDRRKARRFEHERPTEETGGRKGPEPTRYGDWEKNGIASDF